MSKIIVCDSREQNNREVLSYFRAVGQPFLPNTKVDSGDYIYTASKNREDFDYSTIIDLKADLVEVAGNIAGTKQQHERFKREIARGKELGCKRFVVLIREPLGSLEAVNTWKSPVLKNGTPIVRRSPTALYKTMVTMAQRYGIEWKFTNRMGAGQDIIDILSGRK